MAIERVEKFYGSVLEARKDHCLKDPIADSLTPLDARYPTLMRRNS